MGIMVRVNKLTDYRASRGQLAFPTANRNSLQFGDLSEHESEVIIMTTEQADVNKVGFRSVTDQIMSGLKLESVVEG